MQGQFEHRAWLALIITIAAASIISTIGMRSNLLIVNDLAWFAGSVETGHIWRLFTYAFILLEPISLVFILLILWFILPPVEELWGSGMILAYFLAASCLAAGCAMLLSHIAPSIAPSYLLGPGAALIGFMYTFGRRDPDQTFYLMFVIPIKARWFVAGYILLRVIMGFMSGADIKLILVLVGCECAGAALALLLYEGILRLKKRQRDQRRQALTLVEKNTGLTRVHAALWERFKSENAREARNALLAGEREKTFPFAVCPEHDFRPDDTYCQNCAAFGHCLARLSDHAPREIE